MRRENFDRESRKSGTIELCKKKAKNCHYKCCKFRIHHPNHYIVLYPNEYENSHLKKDHLKIIGKDRHGGEKAICLRICRSGDFKPLDCKSYPYFPMINEKGEIYIIKGRKCSLTKKDLACHKRWLLKEWKPLIENKKIFKWLQNVEQKGYRIEKF